MVRLVPMSKSDLYAYLDNAIPGYAEDNVKAGYWSKEEALEKSRDVYKKLLPDGLNTKNEYLYQIRDMETDQDIGVIWLNVKADMLIPSGFIYDIELGEEFRGKGFGKQAMLAIEEKARELGLKSIGLHVFAHNAVAKRLYENIGYEVKSQNMTKQI